MALAAGFVSAGRYLDPGKIVIKRNDDEEFDPSDPGPPLQDQRAAEQNTLVAEMGKANRLSNSITDQMYADCQVGASCYRYPLM